MDILDRQKVRRVSARAFHARQCWNFIEIFEKAKILDRFSFRKLLKQFSKIVETLLSHDSVVSLECDLWRIIIHQIWDSGPCRVTSTTETLSDKNHGIMAVLGHYGLTT